MLQANGHSVAFARGKVLLPLAQAAIGLAELCHGQLR